MKQIKASKESYQRSFLKLLGYVMQTSLRVGIRNEEGKIETSPYSTEWEMGGFKKDFPKNCLVVPTMIDCNLIIGWYRGKDEDGYYLVEDARTHALCKLYNCSFDYNTELTLGERSSNQFYWSDWHWEVSDYLREIYRTTDYNYPIILCFTDFSEDDSEVTFVFRKIFENDFFVSEPVNVKKLLKTSKKEAKKMIEEALNTSGVTGQA